MQFYALEGDLPILAAYALRHKEYLCPECKGVVLVRKGAQREPHFYHPTVPSHCLQHKKSLTHLRIQWLLHDLFPAGQAKMERPFPEIGRIADVAWESGKIVFEVQYSAISLQEAHSRCQDYLSVGFTPIWVLHENQFNKRKLSASEELLRKTGAYYTNINEKGHGEIYDQFDVYIRGKKIFSGPPLKIDLRKPSPLPAKLFIGKEAPQAILRRSGPLYFAGDLLDHFLKTPATSMQEIEKRFLKAPKRPSIWSSLLHFYQIFFRLLLEKACR
jgi:hypothetical protein